MLNGKETRTDQSKWAIDVYTANMDNAIDRQDLHPLIPTNPHKLFRRALLMDHDIRFPEGRRVLCEDVFFNLDVARQSVLTSLTAAGRLTVADLTLPTGPPSVTDTLLTVEGIRVTLTADAAVVLNDAFSTTAFTAGMPLGTAITRADIL